MKIGHSTVILTAIVGSLILMIWLVMAQSPDSPYVRAKAESAPAVP